MNVGDLWRGPSTPWQLRAFLAAKLGASGYPTDDKIVGDFARCVQGLLRAAHGKETCGNHVEMLQRLDRRDCVISFNYDLVAERALREIAAKRTCPFGRWIYGFEQSLPIADNLLLVPKLHGSSNWRLSGDSFDVLTRSWGDFDKEPGYQGHRGEGTRFPIFLPFWDKRIEEEPWLSLWKSRHAD